MQEMRIPSLGREDPLEEGMASCSSILAWRIPWTEKPGRLQSIGLQRVGHDWSDWVHAHMYRERQRKKLPCFFSSCSVTHLCPTLCDPVDCSTPGPHVLHHLPEFTQTHVHWVGDAIQPSHPLSPPSPPAFNLSQHQGLFQWVGSSHQVAKVLELQFQHQSFQWIFRVDFHY